MSRFLLLNFEEFGLNQDITKTIQSQTLFCICCLDRNGPLIDLLSCEHSDYLDNFSKPEVKPFNQVVCYRCHTVLKKIKLFKQQVEESFYILVSESFKNHHENFKNTKVANLKTFKTVDVLLPQTYSTTLQESNPIMASTPETDDKTKTIDNVNVLPKSSNFEKNKKLNNIKTALDIINKNDSLGILASQIQSLASSNIGKAFEILNKEQNVSNKETCAATPVVNSKIKDKREVVENSVMATPEILSIEKIKIEPKEIEIEIPAISSQVPTQKNTQKQVHHPVKAKVKTIQLSKEELMRERSRHAQSVTYLKYLYKCEHCLVGFNYKENLEDHTKRKHGPKLGSVTCEICLQVLFPPGSLNAHNFRHYTRYECLVCSKRFNIYNDAIRHCWQEHTASDNKVKYKCRYCDYSTSSEKKFKFHTTNSHKKFTCDLCGMMLRSRRGLRCHITVAHRKYTKRCSCTSKQTCASTEHPFSCKDCNMRFVKEDQFHKHVLIKHKDDKTGSCTTLRGISVPDTRQSTTQPPLTLIQKHSAAKSSSSSFVHPNKNLSNKCTHCEKTFLMETELKSHMNKCLNRAGRFICDHCRRVYNKRILLIRHLEIHNEDM